MIPADMELLYHFMTSPGPCGYLPDRVWQLEYQIVGSMTVEEYQHRLLAGWRRFGHSVFRPKCPSCTACQSLRIDVPHYRPNRSQNRNRKANQDAIRLVVGDPDVTAEKLELYDRYHAFQAERKDWPGHPPKSAFDYLESFVANPFPTEEWLYYLGERLVGVGYVDVLPDALSAIYFYYDPDERDRGLGTWNVQCILDRAARDGVPYVYLGFYVDGCQSLAYKANFLPNQVLPIGGPDWIDHRA